MTVAVHATLCILSFYITKCTLFLLLNGTQDAKQKIKPYALWSLKNRYAERMMFHSHVMLYKIQCWYERDDTCPLADDRARWEENSARHVPSSRKRRQRNSVTVGENCQHVRKGTCIQVL